MTPEEKRNLSVAEKWERFWNEDPDRMVDECYAADCEAVDMFSGQAVHGREELRSAEHQMMTAMPDRRTTISRRVVAGDVVTVEGHTVGTWTGPFLGHAPTGQRCTFTYCALLTFKDGQVVSDHTYMDMGNLLKQMGIDDVAMVEAMKAGAATPEGNA
jgi:predicted ester cyclase